MYQIPDPAALNPEGVEHRYKDCLTVIGDIRAGWERSVIMIMPAAAGMIIRQVLMLLIQDSISGSENVT